MNDHSLEKDTLLFPSSWGRKKETTWSGTNLNILNEFKKYYDVKEMDTGIRNPYNFVISSMSKLGLVTRQKKIQKLDEHFSRYFKKHYSNQKYCCFSFGTIPDQDNILSFVYQD